MPNLKMESKQASMMVVGGVDTHADAHTVAALDELGRRLGCAVFPATRAGYGALTSGWPGTAASARSESKAPAAMALD